MTTSRLLVDWFSFELEMSSDALIKSESLYFIETLATVSCCATLLEATNSILEY
ncbi:MAG: hypothetical protein WA075_09300 [Lactococcus raffinolactis]